MLRIPHSTAILLCGSILLAGADAPASWTPELMMQVKRVADVRPSPDGQRTLFTVAEAVMTADKSEYLTQIHLGEQGSSRPLTFAEKSSTSPRWSPDGKRIAFLSARGAKAQIWLLRLDGGEAEPLTEVKGVIEAFAWSPDGRSLAFTMVPPKSEAEEKADKAKDDAKWFEEKPQNARPWILPVEKDAKGKREPRALELPAGHVVNLGWSPDGTRLALCFQLSPKVDHWPTRQIAVVDAGTGKVVVPPFSGGQGGSLAYSPDGRWLAYSKDEQGPRWPGHKRY